MIMDAILEVYKQDCLPKVKQFWHDMYDTILANKTIVRRSSLK